MVIKTSKIAVITVKVSVSAFILYILFSKTGFEEVISVIKRIHLPLFFSASLLNIIAIFISSIRWRLLLSRDFSLKRLFSLYMIGSFFNTILPGTTGGDAVKLYYLYKDTKSSNIALGSIFMDRFVGFISMLILGMISFSIGIGKLIGTGMEWFIPVVILLFVIMSFLFFGLRLGKRFSNIAKFYEYFHFYIKQYKVILKTILLSLIMQFTIIVSVYIITISLVAKFNFIDLLIFLPIISIISAVPISISGLGVREGAFVLLFGMVGIKSEVAMTVSFCWFLSTVIAGSIGLYYYFKYKPEEHKGMTA